MVYPKLTHPLACFLAFLIWSSFLSFAAYTSQYLSAACPEVWGDNQGSEIEWAEGTLECEGSGGVTDCMNEEVGSIGYLDSGHGHAEGFEEVYVENSFGTKLTTIEAAKRGGIAAAAAQEGLMPADATGDFSSVSIINQPGEFTWPISLLTYVYVRRDVNFMSHPQEEALLKAFLLALYDDTFVQVCVDDYEFAKVDGATRQLALDGIEMLNINSSAVPFIFEDDTMLVNGTGDYYISGKRRSAADVQIEALESANAKLAGQVSELSAMLAQTMQQVSLLSSGGDVPSFEIDGNEAQAVMSDNESHEDKQDGNIAAALAVSIIALIMSGIALAMFAFRSCAGEHKNTAVPHRREFEDNVDLAHA